jgi:hypothetical protein
MLESHHPREDITTKCTRRQRWFQQDGAPAHRAKSTVQFIRQKINLVDDWPANLRELPNELNRCSEPELDDDLKSFYVKNGALWTKRQSTG